MNKFQKNYLRLFKILKKKKDNLFNPFLKFFDNLGVSASMLTIFSFLLGLLSIYFLFVNKFLFVILILLHLFFDGLDGSLARYQKKVSKLWGDIDYYFDHIVLLGIIIASIFIIPEKQTVIWLLIFVIINNFLFVFFNQKYEIIAIRTVYVIIAIFSIYFASLIALLLCLVNSGIIIVKLFSRSKNI